MRYHLLITYCPITGYNGIVKLSRLPHVSQEVDFITVNAQKVIVLVQSDYKEEVEISS